MGRQEGYLRDVKLKKWLAEFIFPWILSAVGNAQLAVQLGIVKQVGDKYGKLLSFLLGSNGQAWQKNDVLRCQTNLCLLRHRA